MGARQSHGFLGGWMRNVCLDERLKRAAPFLDPSLGFLYLDQLWI